MYGPLVKGFNTSPSQGDIHEFKSRTGHQVDNKVELKKFGFLIWLLKAILYDIILNNLFGGIYEWY